MAALLLLPALAAVQVVTAAPAQAVVVAGFEIDGNTPIDTAGNQDWANAGTHTTDPPMVDDDSNFTGGATELTNPETWEVGEGTTTPQGDIIDVYAHTKTVGDDTYAFLGFRRSATSGTMNYMVEMNQAANLEGEETDPFSFRPDRRVNDLLLHFNQDGNDPFLLQTAYKWTLSPGDGCLLVLGYMPAAGWCPTPITAEAGFAGATGENSAFAEASVNLSAFDAAGDCRGAFGTMNVRSWTGEHITSSTKDFIEAVPITVPPTCGQLVIEKVDQFGEPVGGATFKITPNPVPGVTGAAADELVVMDGSAQDPDGTADGTVSINPAKPGSYTVVETATPAGYILDDTVHTDVVVGGSGTSVATVSFTNPLKFEPVAISNAPRATKDVDHDWRVRKSVDRNHADVPQGTSAEFVYTVTLEATGKTISGRELGGTVTLTNPNAHGMVVTLVATVTDGAACTFPGVADMAAAAGLQVDLAGGAHDFDYVCTPAPQANGSTTATVSWDPATYPQGAPGATYTRSDENPYAYALDQVTDASTTVTDAFDGGAAEDLGTFDWDDVWASNDPAAHTVTVKTYPRTIPGMPGECTPYDNLVSEDADGTSDTERVTVCVGQDLDITKDADLGFQRDLLWSLKKGGPGTVFTGQDANGDLRRMVRYTIDITARGKSDSAWALTGRIWIDNPNGWAVTGTISDTVVIDGKTLTCDVLTADVDGAAGHQVTVPAESVDHELSYTCNGVQEGDYVGNNSVSFDYSADSHEYPDNDDTASRTVAVDVIGDPDPAHQTVAIKDLLEGQDVTADLPQSTFSWTTVNAMPDNTQRINYDVVLGTTANECTPYTNVVSINGLTYDGTSDDHTVKVCSPLVTKSVVADFGQKQPWDLTKQVDKTRVDIAEGGQATFHYTVKATPLTVVDDGTSAWTGAISVRNPSTTTALTVDVADLPAVTGWTCQLLDDGSAVEIAPGATLVIDYECSGAGHPTGTNTVEVSFDQDQVVKKTEKVEFDPRANVRDSVVEVRDDKTNLGQSVLLGEADAADPTTWTFEYSLVKTGAAGACTTYTNNAVALLEASADPTAQAQAELCVEKPLTVDVSAEGTFGVTYPWAIDKEVDRTRVEVDAATGEATFDYTVTVRAGEAQPAGWIMGGTIEVSNPNGYSGGAITLTDADVTTDVGGGAACTATLPAAPVVPAGSPGTLSVPFTCTFTGQPATTGTVSATVEWDPAGPAAQATASDTGPATLTVGQETHRVVDVIDDKTNPSSPVLLEEDLTWSQGLVKTYEYSLTVPGTAGTCVDRTNTAIVDLTPGSGPEGDNPTDQQTVTVCVESPLSAEAQASADLARAYAWSIDKSVDATQRTVDASGTATFHYTVVARAGQSTDSGWEMSGSVTLSNPNTYADGDITADVAAVSDLGGGVACVVTGGDDVVVPAEADGTGSVTLPIECTFASQPASSGELTVTATWDPAGPASSASTEATAPVTFAVRSETNKVVDVVDDKTRPGERVVLEKGVVWSAGLVKTYTYDLALAGGAAGTCNTYTNTAAVDVSVGADPSDSTTTAVCVPLPPPPPPVAPPAPPEVLPAEAFGKAVGKVRATCQGTVRAKLKNRSGVRVTYKLRVGKKVHRIKVRSLENEKFRTKGKARAKVTLKLGKKVLDRVRIPRRCAPPELLPATGLRAPAVQARLAGMTTRWN